VDNGVTWKLFGVMQTLASQMQMTEGEAFSFLSRLTSKDVPIQRIYELIHSTTNKPILVDKSPDYTTEIRKMQQAEEMFEDPKYLFIHRHPGAVIESWNRMKGEHWGLQRGQPLDRVERLKTIEHMWLKRNQNIVEFLGDIPSDRQLWVDCKSLVKDTESTMRGVTKLLDVEFNAAVLSPYTGERLLHGLGDPNICSRKTVDASLVNSWREQLKDLALDDATIHMAGRLGYDVAV